MNHRLFKDWLLSEEPLTTDQKQALQEHMLDCESCRNLEQSWDEVQVFFQKLPAVAPAPGFTLRWQERLTAQRMQRQRYYAWGMIALTAVAVLVLCVLFSAQIVEALRSPAEWLLVWFTRTFTLVSIIYAAQNFLSSISEALPALSFIGLFFTTGVISFMSVLWLATYRTLTTARRYVQ